MSVLSLAGLKYTSEVLQLVAVPAAAFELMSVERRERIEVFLLHNLRRTIKSVLWIVALLYLSVVLLVVLGPYLVLLFLVFNRLIMGLVVHVKDVNDPRSLARAVVSSLVVAGSITLAALIVTVIPRMWLHAISWPFESFSAWASRSPVLDWFVPDYRSVAFVEHFENVFEAIETWLWSWLAWLNFTYFFFAKGLMLILLLFVQVAFASTVALIVWLIPAFAAYAFVLVSDYLKQASGLETKGRIPLGALLMWGLGELLGFALATGEFLGYVHR